MIRLSQSSCSFCRINAFLRRSYKDTFNFNFYSNMLLLCAFEPKAHLSTFFNRCLLRIVNPTPASLQRGDSFQPYCTMDEGGIANGVHLDSSSCLESSTAWKSILKQRKRSEESTLHLWKTRMLPSQVFLTGRALRTFAGCFSTTMATLPVKTQEFGLKKAT